MKIRISCSATLIIQSSNTQMNWEIIIHVANRWDRHKKRGQGKHREVGLCKERKMGMWLTERRNRVIRDEKGAEGKERDNTIQTDNPLITAVMETFVCVKHNNKLYHFGPSMFFLAHTVNAQVLPKFCQTCQTQWNVFN